MHGTETAVIHRKTGDKKRMHVRGVWMEAGVNELLEEIEKNPG